MSWGFLITDKLVDMVKSAGVPTRKGASLAPYDRQVDRIEVQKLLKSYDEAWADFGYNNDQALVDLSVSFAVSAIEDRGRALSFWLAKPLSFLAHALLISEPGFQRLHPPEDLTTLSQLQLGELAIDLRYRIAFLNTQATQEIAVGHVYVVLIGIIQELHDALSFIAEPDIPLATVELLDQIKDPHAFMTQLIAQLMNDQEVQDADLFQPLIRQLYRNILEASGVVIDPDIPLFANDTAKPTLPKDLEHQPASMVLRAYFANTPFLDLFSAPLPFSLPQEQRFEHMHVLAGTGHGKTQTLQHLIVQDLQRPVDEVPSMVILDSQGDMLNTLKRLSLFDPMIENSLARRLLIIDPSDVHFAPALNLFDIQSDRLKNYNQRDQEQVLAGIIEIYDYIFGGLLGAELTQKQAMVFRFLAQLMLAIPGATIHTLRDLLIDAEPFSEHIQKLPATARGFFETQFFTRGYNATREQILRRLYGVLQNPSFERMFASPQNRLDLFDVLNEGGIVLVDTAKDFMKTESSSMFGRYIIALTFKAAMERAILPHHQRRPTFLWIDEASEYFDDNIDSLLIQARKFKLGLTMAHQYLGQLPRGLPASMMTNTSIKLAGGISDRDAKQLAPEMHVSPDTLTGMLKERSQTNFAAFVRNVTPQAMKLSIPFGTAEDLPRMPEESFEILLNASRKRLSPQPEEPKEEAKTVEAPPDSASTIPRSDGDELWESY